LCRTGTPGQLREQLLIDRVQPHRRCSGLATDDLVEVHGLLSYRISHQVQSP
jgi:hypothetical protein